MKQINFSRLWTKIVPWLDHPDVQVALSFGLFAYNPHYCPGDPPYLQGAIGWNEGRIKPGKLSWYQPLSRCHYIVPFSWAIGKKLYPKLKWGFLTSERHSVAVGLDGDEIMRVADILLFKSMMAEESIDHVKAEPWYLCLSPGELYGPMGVQAWNRCQAILEPDSLVQSAFEILAR